MNSNYATILFEVNHDVADSSKSWLGSSRAKYGLTVYFTKTGVPQVRLNGKMSQINPTYILGESNRVKFDNMVAVAQPHKKYDKINLDEAETRRFIEVVDAARKEFQKAQGTTESKTPAFDKKVESHHGKIAELSAKILMIYSSYCHPIMIAQMTGEEDTVAPFDDPREKLCALCLKAGIIDELPQVIDNFDKFMSKYGHTSIYNSPIQNIPSGDQDLLKEIKL